ncbi:MAG TPA: hypothetical protein VM509_06190, partial [Planctomycetota bacterium]|nr:hypothetical protein [Planctomycetota bacterium]
MRGARFLLVLALCACQRQEPPVPKAPPLDPRVAVLFDPSMARGAYDVDLADPTPILVATLMVGELDPMRRAKTELANDGERGIAAMRRLIERFRDDPAGTDYLRNAADVLSLSPEPSATPLLESLLDHPSESLRMQVLRGLLVHPRPQSFDRVVQSLSE